jgi:hypothetical protein
MVKKSGNMGWIKLKDELPEEGKYVLVRVIAPWTSPDPNIKVVVASIELGLSREDRAKLDPNSKAARSWCRSDEQGSNKVPYCFVNPSGHSFNGSDVVEWTYIPE